MATLLSEGWGLELVTLAFAPTLDMASFLAETFNPVPVLREVYSALVNPHALSDILAGFGDLRQS